MLIRRLSTALLAIIAFGLTWYIAFLFTLSPVTAIFVGLIAFVPIIIVTGGFVDLLRLIDGTRPRSRQHIHGFEVTIIQPQKDSPSQVKASPASNVGRGGTST